MRTVTVYTKFLGLGASVIAMSVAHAQVLPPVGGSSSSAATQQKPATTPAKQPATQAANKPAADQKATKVIGKLGQSTAATNIYASTSTRSKVLWRNLKAFQYLVVNPTKDKGWYAVLLSNGRTGYVVAEKVAELPYDVEVPKDYQLTSRGSSSRTARTASFSSTGKATGTPTDKQSMLEYSYKYIGTKYVWGGNSLTGGIDCSGFVKELFEMIGEDLPRTAAEQARVGQPVNRLEDLQPGDRLYFWDKKRNKIGHTGIFLGFFQDGGAYFIHSSTTNHGVATDDLRVAKWRNMLVAARR